MSIVETVARLRDLAAGRRPKFAVILGSGWQTFTDRIDDALAIPYAALPALPDVNVGGHANRLVLGRVGGREVAVFAGRQHAYESGRADGMKAALCSMAAFGVTTLVQTNAAARGRGAGP
jgi:purine-nucleoside phosphorylase